MDRPAHQRALKAAFGRVIDLYLVLEEVCEDKRTGRETIRPHFPGEIAISADEAELARKVIRKAVGEWEIGRRQFQVITEANPDFDWASYATEQAWKATPSMRARLLASERPSIRALLSGWRVHRDPRCAGQGC